MGGQDTPAIKVQIINGLNDKIKTINDNLTSIVNNAISTNTTQTTNTIANQIIADTIADANVNSSNAGGNFLLGDQSASENSVNQITQEITINAVNFAIIRILQDRDSMLRLGNNISSSVISQINSNNEARENLQTLSKIKTQVQNQGGPEQFVNFIMNQKVGPILFGNSINKQTDITNAINELINNTVITETSFTNIINTSINTKINMAATATCDFSVTAVNWLEFNSINTSENARFNDRQTININSFNKCFIDLKIGNAISDNILGNIKFITSNNTISNSSSNDLVVTAKPPTTNPPSTNPPSSNNNILYISLGVGGLIVFLILIFFLTRDGHDDDQYGGASNNLYLYATLFALFLFISTKSITMCGLILFGFVFFILYSVLY